MPVARVRIVNDNVVLDVPDGSQLLSYAKEGSNMLFGCENGVCGTCICTVIEGMANLMDKADAERTLLAKRGAFPNQRLACRIWVKRGDVVIEY